MKKINKSVIKFKFVVDNQKFVVDNQKFVLTIRICVIN